MPKKLFTSDYQPKDRGRKEGSKNRKTMAKEYLQSLMPNGKEIDAMSVKTFIIQTLLQKDKHTVTELELMNNVVKDLIEYQLIKPDKEVVVIHESGSVAISTADMIANWKLEDDNE